MLTPDDPQALPSTGAPPAPLAAVPAAPPDQAPVLIPLSEEELAQWRTRVSRARLAQKDWHKVWDANLDAYQPKPQDLSGDADRYDVNPNVDFRQVEQKKAQLFYDRPEVLLEAEEPLGTALNAAQVVTLRQAVINKFLGPKPDGVDVLRTVQMALLDILAIAGIGWTKIGWRIVTKDVPPDAETIAAGGPTDRAVPVPIYSRPFWDYLPVKRGLIPHDAIGLESDDWDWIGQDFAMPLTQARQEFTLPDDFQPSGDPNLPKLRDRQGRFEKDASVPQVSGTEIHYYRSRFNGDVVHPDVVYELVLLDGLEGGAARHRPCPYQTIGPDGRLTDDSVTGYLLHPLAVRDPASGAYPLSDSSVTRPLVEQLKVYLSQQVMLRDATQPIIAFKESGIDASQRDSLKANGYLRVFPITDEEWQSTDGIPIKSVALPAQSRDNYEGQAIFERKIEQSLGINSNQQGVSNTGRRSATEIQTVNAATDTLLAAQQARLTDGFLKGVRKLDALIQRMAKGKDIYVKILGPDGAQTLESIDPAMVPGRMLYKIRPDSQLRVDAAQDRAQALQYYNLIANSPSANRYEVESWLTKKFGLDPAKMLTPPQPPPPPAPKVSASVTMPDLLTPAAPIAIKVLTNQPITPDDVAIMEGLKSEMPPVDAQGEALPQGQPEHGGPAEKAEPLDAHQSRRTAGMEGVGA